MSDEEKQETPKEIKIPHKRSKQFTSHFATGAICSGPTSDGFVHLIFYADAVGVENETGELKTESEGKAEYTSTLRPNDLISFREDKTRVSMPQDALERIYAMLKRRFDREAEQK